MKTKNLLYYFSISVSIMLLITFICVFIVFIFTPYNVLLIEPNGFTVSIELTSCVIGLFGMILLCNEMINDGK